MAGNKQSVFLSADQLAIELNMSRMCVYRGLRDGVIPSIRIGKRFKIPRVAIQRWLENAGKPDAAKPNSEPLA